MRERYELQYKYAFTHRWNKSLGDSQCESLESKKKFALDGNRDGYEYRVVQKLGRKVIKVVYPKV